jgi:hypothetical protein
MHRITNHEVDFILSDIESRGIVLEDLRDNLLDHLCCIVEDEMNEGENFKQFYESVLPRFFKEKLEEIQTETDNLIRFKNFYTMKKILKISGIATAILIVCGAVLKSFHLPGASVAIILGGGLFSFVFLPLLIAIKFKDEDSKVDKAVFTIGFLLAIILSVSLTFKLMHWPYATAMLQWTTGIFTFIYVPIYFFTRVKRPELRFNASVNSVLMLACGGIFYTLFNLNYADNFSEQMISANSHMHDSSVKLISSNERLYLMEEQNEEAGRMHSLTIELNDQLELLAAQIVEQFSTNDVTPVALKAKEKIAAYNDALGSFKIEGLQKLDQKGIEDLNRMTLEVALNSVARVQQEVIVNETTYLTSIRVAHE